MAATRSAQAAPPRRRSASATVGCQAVNTAVTKSRYSAMRAPATSGGPRFAKRSSTTSTPGTGVKSVRWKRCVMPISNHGWSSTAGSVVAGRPLNRSAASRCTTKYWSSGGTGASVSARTIAAVRLNGMLANTL